jgi:hypothetical protein
VQDRQIVRIGLNKGGGGVEALSGRRKPIVLARLLQPMAQGSVHPPGTGFAVRPGSFPTAQPTPGARVEPINKRDALGAAPGQAGAPKPDITTVEAYKAALLAAKSIGYSHGCSGTHAAEGIEKLGLATQLKPKTKFVDDGPADRRGADLSDLRPGVARAEPRRSRSGLRGRKSTSGVRSQSNRPTGRRSAAASPSRWSAGST